MPPYFAFQLLFEFSDILASRQISLTDFNTVMIWCSVNRALRMMISSKDIFSVERSLEVNGVGCRDTYNYNPRVIIMNALVKLNLIFLWIKTS